MTQTFKTGDVVMTGIFGGPTVGRVLYVQPRGTNRDQWLVVADWKCGTDINNRRQAVWQQGVPVALVDAAE